VYIRLVVLLYIHVLQVQLLYSYRLITSYENLLFQFLAHVFFFFFCIMDSYGFTFSRSYNVYCIIIYLFNMQLSMENNYVGNFGEINKLKLCVSHDYSFLLK